MEAQNERAGATDAIDPSLLRWVESETGGRIMRVWIAASGFARLTAILDLEDGGVASAVLRHDTGAGSLAGTAFSLEHEAIAYRSVEPLNLPVPRLLTASRDGRTILVEKAEGQIANAHEALPDLLTQLGRLHAARPRDLNLGGFTAPGLHDLDGWERIYRERVTRKSPLLDFAFPLLRRLQPPMNREPVFCHGDPGAGNYLVDGDRVTAMLDWELSHLGDPMDDLAWISIRASQYGLALDNFGELVERFWSPASGMAPDNDRLRYWQAVGLVRMLAMCLASTTQPRKGRERLLHMLIEPVFENQLILLLAEITDEQLPPRDDQSPVELLRFFPADEITEAAEDISESFLPLTAGTHRDPWLRRIRQLLRQVGERGAAFTAMSGSPDDEAPSLAGFYRRSCGRLAWLPRSAALAARPLASFNSPIPAGSVA